MSEVGASNPLDERRQRVFDALQELNSEFAGYYRVAIGTLIAPALSGDQRAKVSAICNAFREIMNGFGSLLGETTSAVIEPSSGKLLADFPDVRLEISENDEVIPVSREVAIALDGLLKTTVLEHARTAEDTASLLAGTKQEGHALLRTWKGCTRFFQEWTHWSRKQRSTPTPTDEELEAQILKVENIIEARVGAFFETRHKIKDLLAEANRTEEGPES